MTLILSEVTSRFALQVSDRLVTVSSGSVVRPHDTRANKSIIFEASNGVASISFTGLAYIDGVPTDCWIAKELNGTQFPIDPSREFGMRSAIRRSQWPTFGLAIGKLANALTEVASRPNSQLRKIPIGLAVCGWIWYRKKYPRPFLTYVGADQAGKYGIGWHFNRRGPFFLQMPVPNGYVTRQESSALDSFLGTAEENSAAAEMCRLIRTVASRTRTVGADCMQIVIAHPYAANREIVATFQRSNPHTDRQHGTAPPPDYLAYSPWVVGRHLCFEPLITMGAKYTFDLGDYKLILSGPHVSTTPPGSTFAVIEPQQRPKAP